MEILRALPVALALLFGGVIVIVALVFAYAALNDAFVRWKKH